MPGHAHVEHQHLRLAHRDALDGRVGALGLVDLEVEDLAGRTDESPQAGIVVNEQQPHREPPYTLPLSISALQPKPFRTSLAGLGRHPVALARRPAGDAPLRDCACLGV